jgi:AraC-like DNA-binding protein
VKDTHPIAERREPDWTDTSPPPHALPQVLGKQRCPRATLHVWPEGGIWIGHAALDAPHQHFTASIKIALSGSFRVRARGTGWFDAEAILTAPNAEQQLDGRGARVASVLVDPETDAYARLMPRLAASRAGVSVLPSALVQELRSEVSTIGSCSGSHVRAWDAIIARLSPGPVRPRSLDPRVRRIAAVLKREFAAPRRVAELAELVKLSEGRLTHLFSEEMGLPLRQYVLWLRVRDVVFSLAAGATLTKAAHDAGFSDSPHLSRTFRAMFGDPPSILVPGRGHFDLRMDVETALRRPGPHAEVDRARIARIAAARGLNAA